MTWTHDTGYEPARKHVGSLVAVQTDGTEATRDTAPIRLGVIGWRSACDCGWRGADFHPCNPHNHTGLVAVADVGREFDRVARVEWERHLQRAMPELAVHDRAVELSEAQRRLDCAILAARLAGSAGLNWSALLTLAYRRVPPP